MYNDENEYRYNRDELPKDEYTPHASYTGYSSYTAEPQEPKKKKGIGKFFAKVVAAALIFGIVASAAFSGTTYLTQKVTGKDSQQEQQTEVPFPSNETVYSSSNVSSTTTNVISATALDVSDVVEQTMPSIVQISCITQYSYWGRVQEATSAGSGIIVAESGEYIYIATNNHVVDGASSISAIFIDDETVSAEIKGTDPDNDLAVLAIKISDIPATTLDQIKVASIGDSSSIKVGQTAIAIGNALGYGQSVTTGVISALDREVTIDNVTNELIQTDAAINPGNSGGALINASGEVIGINSAKYSDTSVEGMGYAIPISTAMPIIEELIEREVVDASRSAYLGVAGQDVTAEIAQMYGMPEGLYITRVMEGSAAQTYGLYQGDIITSFDGHNISSMEDLQNLMQYYAAGTQVDITVQRNTDGAYEEVTLSVVLGKKAS